MFEEAPPFIVEITAIIVGIVASNLLGYFAGVRRSQREMRKMIYALDTKVMEEIVKVKADTGLVHKTLIMWATRIDEQTKQAHPGTDPKLRQMTKDMLGKEP